MHDINYRDLKGIDFGEVGKLPTCGPDLFINAALCIISCIFLQNGDKCRFLAGFDVDRRQVRTPEEVGLAGFGFPRTSAQSHRDLAPQGSGI
jgi:hypothetical protein